MKRILKFIAIIVGTQFIVSLPAIADTTWVSGVIDTNTVWDTAGSPYIVIGDVTVNTNVTLDIKPRVVVRLDSAKCIIINGILNAIGTVADSIIISATDTTKRWSRLWFKPASYCTLKYCRIEYAGNSTIYGEIACSLYIGYNTIRNNSGEVGGGICSYYGSPTIIGNIITNNYARSGGGGIYSYHGSPTITNNIIINNSGGWWGGGIDADGSPTISGNTITNNYAYNEGGGIYSSGSPTITGNTITNNYANYGGGVCIWSCYGLSPTIKYNTITDTTASAIYIYSDSAVIVIDSNNLYATRYAVYNDSTDDIDARYNYWGTESSDTIALFKIWDFYDDSTKGIVYYEPFSADPYNFGVEEHKSQVTSDKLQVEVYPNPSFGNMVIKYGLPKKANVSLKLYDISGRLAKTIYSGAQEAGYYKVNVSRFIGIPDGIYFIQLRSDEFRITKKLIILR